MAIRRFKKKKKIAQKPKGKVPLGIIDVCSFAWLLLCVRASFYSFRFRSSTSARFLFVSLFFLLHNFRFHLIFFCSIVSYVNVFNRNRQIRKSFQNVNRKKWAEIVKNQLSLLFGHLISKVFDFPLLIKIPRHFFLYFFRLLFSLLFLSYFVFSLYIGEWENW